MKIYNYIKLMRLNHYIKNGFIFFPLFFSLQITDINLLVIIIKASILFSILTSAVYIFNDMFDIESDKVHPEKKNRMLASGKVGITEAKILFILLLSISMLSAYNFNRNLFYLMLAYFILNVLYTLYLKNVPVADILIIASGFVIRVIIGGVVISVPLSKWIILCIICLSLFLALSKRRKDVVLYNATGIKTRAVAGKYSIKFLNISIFLISVITILCYIMYTRSPDVINRTGTNNLFITSIFVITGIVRYLQQLFIHHNNESLIKIVYSDRYLQGSVLGWIISLIILIYI